MTNVVFALLHVGLVWRYQVNISLSFEIQNIDLVLVSTAFQRLDLSEFEFLFQVCEYFHVARHLIKHWTKIVKSHNKKTIEDFLFFPCNLTRTLLPPMWSPSPSLLSQFKLLRGQLLLEEKMSAPPTGCMLLYNLSISPSCLPLHQGILLPRSLLWPPLFRVLWILHLCVCLLFSHVLYLVLSISIKLLFMLSDQCWYYH